MQLHVPVRRLFEGGMADRVQRIIQ
jgi:hypothetical protein